MKKDSLIFVAGYTGLVGSSILRRLKKEGYENLLVADKNTLDLADQKQTLDFFKQHKPEYVFMSAAKVGGIFANNTYPAEFIYENLMIESNVIHSSYVCGVKKLLFLGSSCIYPKFANQPIKEESLLTGLLESTNEPYAIAKIAGIKMCQAYSRQYGANFISAMPTNLYGYFDNFDLNNSHVLPAMIRKFHEAKSASLSSVELWGTGSPFREFLFVDDLAKACVFLMENYDDPGIVNIGTGRDISVRELAELIKKVVGFQGSINWDSSKPDGTPKKQLDVSKINSLGWTAGTDLETGIRLTYDWFIKNFKPLN